MRRVAASLGWLALFAATSLRAADLPCWDGKPISYHIRWKAPDDLGAGIDSYRIYVALKSEGYVGFFDAGLPTPDTEGIFGQDVGGFDPTVPSFVVMTAFGPGGESPQHSNELQLPPVARSCAPPGKVLLLDFRGTLDGQPIQGTLQGTVTPAP